MTDETTTTSRSGAETLLTTALLLGAIAVTALVPTAAATDAGCGDPLRGEIGYATCRLADGIDHTMEETSDERGLIDDMLDAAGIYLRYMLGYEEIGHLIEVPPPR